MEEETLNPQQKRWLDVDAVLQDALKDDGLHPSVRYVLQQFSFIHLPEERRNISVDFCSLAVNTAYRAPRQAETTVALRALLEAKDAAVRAPFLRQF